MADTVQYLMEQMVPELEDLERRGYFTRAEVKTIVQKRQGFEYQLKRRAALKEDFYRYIEYESKLEELRRYRKQKLRIKGKKGLAEVAIVRRIHFIYERATRKFRSDLSLWMRWIDTCKHYRSAKRLSRVIAKALQRHSGVAEIWIEAARWEFDTKNNITSARSLMQQGIRACKASEAIWVRYYQLELLYALKLRVRRAVLGLDGLAEGEDAAAEGRGSAAAVRTVLAGGVARIVFKNAVKALPQRLAFRARFLDVLRGFDFDFAGGLLDQVYDSIRQDFGQEPEAWDLLARRPLDFPAPAAAAASRRGEAEDAEAAARVLQREQAAAAAAAQQEQEQAAGGSGLLGAQGGGDAAGSDSEGEPSGEGGGEEGAQAGGAEGEQQRAGAWDADAYRAACAVYEQGLAAVPTPRMYQLFAQFLTEALERLMAAGEAALDAAVGTAAALFGLLQRAHAAGASTPDTYAAWAEWAERVAQPKMALKAARKGCERFPEDVSLWRRRLALEQALAASQQRPDAGELLAPFTAALRATRPDQASDVWRMAVDLLPAGAPEFGALADMLAAACAKTAKKAAAGGLGQVAAAMVEKAREQLGTAAARQLYGKLLAVPGAGGDLYRCAIALERAEASGAAAAAPAGGPQQQQQQQQEQGSKAAAKRVTELYEQAVAAYGSTEADLWIGYAQWLAARGRGAGQVYWRATKALADPDAFVEEYRRVVEG